VNSTNTYFYEKQFVLHVEKMSKH